MNMGATVILNDSNVKNVKRGLRLKCPLGEGDMGNNRREKGIKSTSSNVGNRKQPEKDTTILQHKNKKVAKKYYKNQNIPTLFPLQQAFIKSLEEIPLWWYYEK